MTIWREIKVVAEIVLLPLAIFGGFRSLGSTPLAQGNFSHSLQHAFNGTISNPLRLPAKLEVKFALRTGPNGDDDGVRSKAPARQTSCRRTRVRKHTTLVVPPALWTAMCRRLSLHMQVAYLMSKHLCLQVMTIWEEVKDVARIVLVPLASMGVFRSLGDQPRHHPQQHAARAGHYPARPGQPPLDIRGNHDESAATSRPARGAVHTADGVTRRFASDFRRHDQRRMLSHALAARCPRRESDGENFDTPRQRWELHLKLDGESQGFVIVPSNARWRLSWRAGVAPGQAALPKDQTPPEMATGTITMRATSFTSAHIVMT
ncbi:hypothetical protein JKP88DRAFT_253290 [Tribonema minus]|uniref:Uncharacterized protein n=1 Tax=Tribonema minus TaxID=303371 RepID=A0A835Z8T8_9STRA|nr:hypothetical protein JKP88DRAFT_253290 [Tribonema minus]